MPTVAELNVVITAQDRASAQLRLLGADVQRVERQVEGAGGAFGRLSGAVSGLGQIGLAAGGIGAIVDTLRGAAGAVGGLVSRASDLNEQLTRTEQIFGDASGSVQDVARTTAQSLGISRTEALQAAGNFGTLFRTTGLSAQASAEMSTRLVNLAADLASFNNIDPSEALEKLRSGLVGEAEPLRTVGVLLSENAVTERALQMGLASRASDLTEANKVQARYALILEQTATAQGDFQRTSTGLANAQRILRASFADIGTELGGQVLPVVAALTSAFARALPDAIHAVRGLVAAFTIDAGAMGNVLDAVRRIFGDTVANAIQPFVHRFMEAIPAIRAFAQSLTDQLRPALAALSGGDLLGALDRVGPLVAGVGAQLQPALATWTAAFVGWVQAVAPQVLDVLRGLGERLLAWVAEQAPVFWQALVTEWAPAFLGWLQVVAPPLLAALADLGGQVFAWISAQAPPLLERLVGEWAPAFFEWVATVGPPLLFALGALLEQLATWVLTTGLPALARLGLALGDALIRGLQRALERLGPAIGEALDRLFAQNPIVATILAGALPGGTLLTPGARAAAGAAAPGVGAAAGAAAAAAGQPITVNIGGVDVNVPLDPQQAATQVGAAVAAQVYAALTGSQAATDPGASTRLQGAGR